MSHRFGGVTLLPPSPPSYSMAEEVDQVASASRGEIARVPFA